MRFMMLLKADKRTEAGVLPSRQDLEVMGKCVVHGRPRRKGDVTDGNRSVSHLQR